MFLWYRIECFLYFPSSLKFKPNSSLCTHYYPNTLLFETQLSSRIFVKFFFPVFFFFLFFPQICCCLKILLFSTLKLSILNFWRNHNRNIAFWFDGNALDIYFQPQTAVITGFELRISYMQWYCLTHGLWYTVLEGCL